MSAEGSFLKRTTLYRTLGFMVLMLILASIIVLAAKSCTQATASELEARQLNSVNDRIQIKRYVDEFFLTIHILHVLSAGVSFLIIVLSFIDLAPKQNEDAKFAFHFILVFTVFCVGLSTLYASFVAFVRPCLAPEGVTCCQVLGTPGILNESNKPPLTSVNTDDAPLIAVMVLDLISGMVLVLTSLIYFRDVRNVAEQCGYLYRVHNEGYIIRNHHL